MNKFLMLVSLTLLSLSLVTCGQKGPLYLPKNPPPSLTGTS